VCGKNLFVADGQEIREMTPTQNSEAGTFLATLRVLFNKGVRYSTVIDLGCADGHFFLTLWSMGIIPGAVPLNIDANRLYEASLKAIKAVAGGDYRISAITDHDGDIELTNSVHPYWSSLRPENDPYWRRINSLSSTKTIVSATTLDLLRKQHTLRPPFLLKLDVQGAEQEALRGATDVLKDTYVVICEADIEDFRDIDSILAKHDFALYDVTALNRIADGTLGWFYPVYVNRALHHLRPKEFWNPKDNEAVIQMQVQRRQSILNWNAEILARMQHQQPLASIHPKQPGRNERCPCGSGKKYKHCCGSNQ
jgi:FkbM family methyltransferase